MMLLYLFILLGCFPFNSLATEAQVKNGKKKFKTEYGFILFWSFIIVVFLLLPTLFFKKNFKQFFTVSRSCSCRNDPLFFPKLWNVKRNAKADENTCLNAIYSASTKRVSTECLDKLMCDSFDQVLLNSVLQLLTSFFLKNTKKFSFAACRFCS